MILPIHSTIKPILTKSEFKILTNDNFKILTNAASPDKETVGENEPLSRFLTKEDYKPNSSSIMTYIQYFWTGGLLMTVILLILTLFSNALLFLSYWWMQAIATCSERRALNLSNVSFADTSNQSLFLTCSWHFSDSTNGSLALLTFFTFSGTVSMFLYAITFYYILLQASRLFIIVCYTRFCTVLCISSNQTPVVEF